MNQNKRHFLRLLVLTSSMFGFGYALERIRGRAWVAAVAALAICAVAELPFLLRMTY